MSDNEKKNNFLNDQWFSIVKFNIRFFHHVTKIAEYLNEIENLLQNPFEHNEIDDEAVLKRERRIASEFVRRFSRNTLYPVQLKIYKLENAITVFCSGKCCELTQAHTLQIIILSLLKYLSNSARIYLKFLRKCKIKTYVKLKIILNCITYSFKLMKLVVEHQVFDILNLSDMCSNILNLIQDRTSDVFSLLNVKSNVKLRRPIVCSKIKRITKTNKCKEEYCKVRKINVLQIPVSEKKINEVNSIHHPNNNAVMLSKNKLHTKLTTKLNYLKQIGSTEENNIAMLNKIKIEKTVTIVCDRLLDSLIKEIVWDITGCIQNIAVTIFSQEFEENL